MRMTGRRWGPRVSGYISPPSLNRANRRQMIFFVNGRWIRDRSLSYAVIQAYYTLLPTGRFPISVVHIEMDAAEVDVNVHPTKSEVRFREPGKIFGLVQRQVRATLIDRAPVPESDPWKSPAPREAFHSQQSAGWDWERRQRLVNAGRSQAELALDVVPPVEGELGQHVDRREPSYLARRGAGCGRCMSSQRGRMASI